MYGVDPYDIRTRTSICSTITVSKSDYLCSHTIIIVIQSQKYEIITMLSVNRSLEFKETSVYQAFHAFISIVFTFIPISSHCKR